MRIVTWNINGLGSLKFPFHIHAHHTHRYPPVDTKAQTLPTTVPADEYDVDETLLTDSSSSPSTPLTSVSRDVSDTSTAGIDSASTAELSPHDPSFPAFPDRRLPLTDVQVASYDELISYFQADVVCLQEVKIGRGRMDLLAKAVRQQHHHSRKGRVGAVQSSSTHHSL